MVPGLEFHPVREHAAPPHRLAELLREFRGVLHERGMASIDEYGDMLQWGLPMEGGVYRKFHAFHPDWCSWDDRFRGTVHFHGGWIRGTLLAGRMEHHTYRAEKAPDGERFYAGEAYRLTRHTRVHDAGTVYELPAMVPHWITPTALTLTYFEEQASDVVSDLVDPASEAIDDHRWDQAQAEALLPEILDLIDARLAALAPRAVA